MSNLDMLPADVRQIIELAFQLANRWVVEDICGNAAPVDEIWPAIGTQRCYDVRPMLDLREHSPEVVDMSAEALQYALDAQVIERHPEHTHLVRLLKC